MSDEPKLGDVWYRYYDGQRRINLAYFSVVKVTPKCVYLWETYVPEENPGFVCLKYCKRVLKQAERRYAYPTKELAADSYRKRKRWQKKHLVAAMEKLAIMEELMGKSGEINLDKEVPMTGLPHFMKGEVL